MRTEVTKIITALGMLPCESVEEALWVRPTQLLNMTDAHWDTPMEACGSPSTNEISPMRERAAICSCD